MLIELINKLKFMKKQIQNYTLNNNVETNIIQEKNNFEITISNENNIYKIEISDYITISDYINKMKSSEKYDILYFICNSVSWNNKKQKINKGTYYVIKNDNSIYNILFTDEKIKINERIKIELDEQTKKENITQERSISFNINNNEYNYFSAKHDKNGDTFYTRYYDKNRLYSFLELSEKETYDEINLTIYNLERIEGIENILDINMLKINILENLSQRKNLQRVIVNNNNHKKANNIIK